MHEHEVDVLPFVALGNLLELVDEEGVARDIDAVLLSCDCDIGKG